MSVEACLILGIHFPSMPAPVSNHLSHECLYVLAFLRVPLSCAVSRQGADATTLVTLVSVRLNHDHVPSIRDSMIDRSSLGVSLQLG